jgi:hypothetical protein
LKNNNYHTLKLPLNKSFPCIVLKPGLAGRSGVGTRPGWKKNRGRKNPTDSARPGQKLGCNPLTFFFFTKITSFWFKKNKIDPTTRLKSGTQTFNRVSHQIRYKNYVRMSWKSTPNTGTFKPVAGSPCTLYRKGRNHFYFSAATYPFFLIQDSSYYPKV